MARVCVRPGCDRVARARLSYDVVGCQVWLDPLTERAGNAQEICDLHTERLTVPRGWMLCDRRGDEPALFVPPEPLSEVPSESTPAPIGRPGRRRRSRRDGGDGADLVLFSHASPLSGDGPVPDEPAPDERAPDEPGPGERALDEPAHDEQIRDERAEEQPSLDDVEQDAPSGDDAPPKSDDEIPEPDDETPEPDDETGQQDQQEREEPAALRATTPLLARAFSTTGPQRSVLTQFFDRSEN